MDILLFLVVLLLLSIAGIQSSNVPLSHQVHLALNPGNRLAISWVTYKPYSNEESPVLYLSDKKPSNNNITNTSTTITGYTLSNYESSRYYHHCITPELIGNKTYYYQPGKNASAFSFVSPLNTTESQTITTDLYHSNPSKHKPSKPKPVNNPLLTMIAFGDMGVTYSQDTIALLKSMTDPGNKNYTKIDLISHIGDISYADDRDKYDTNPEYIPIYDEWGTSLEPIFSRVPYMVGPGNHEMSCHSFTDDLCESDLRNFSTYRHYFRMPQEANGVLCDICIILLCHIVFLYIMCPYIFDTDHMT